MRWSNNEIVLDLLIDQSKR